MSVVVAARTYFADYIHISREMAATLCVVSLITASSTFTNLWAVREARNAQQQAERVVIYVDANSLPLGYAMAGAKWKPEARNYISFATTWLRNLRARPRDPGQLTFQYTEVNRTTDNDLRQRLQESRDESDRRVQIAAIDIDQVSVIMQDDTVEGRAIMRARWRETMRNSTEKPVVWNALLTVVYVKDKITETNILGLYVKEFQQVQDSQT